MSLDTLRNDRIAGGGNARCYSPTLDHFIRNSAYFCNARTAIPLTGPSHTTIMTGLLPIHHGSRVTADALAKNVGTTLAQILHAHGYNTFAVISASVLWPRLCGLDRGFQHYVSIPEPTHSDDFQPFALRDKPDRSRPVHTTLQSETKHIQAQPIAARQGKRKMKSQLQAMSTSTWPGVLKVVSEWFSKPTPNPSFFFVHLYDVHIPYQHPAPYSQFYTRGYSGPITGSNADERKFSDPELRKALSSADAHAMIGCYDSGVSYVDKAMETLLEMVRQRGNADNTLWIILSDHGEGFGEFGDYFSHGNYLSDAELHVPWIMYWPGKILPQLISTPVGLEDVCPTILDLLDVPLPENLDGYSRKSTLLDQTPAHAFAHLAETSTILNRKPIFKQFCLIEDGYKYIAPVAQRPAQLFNLRTDPAEKENLVQTETRRSARMDTRIRDMMIHADQTIALPEMDNTTRNALKALGYIQ